MKVYIIYDRYEKDEWFSVDYIGTRKSESIKKFKEECLPSFLKCNPDDCHSYQLQVVEMTKKQYEQLLDWYNNPTMSLEEGPYYDFMCEVWEQGDWSDTGNILMSTDGYSEYPNIVRYYGVVVKGKDRKKVVDFYWEFTDEYEDLYDELMNNDDLLERMCKEYVKYNF